MGIVFRPIQIGAAMDYSTMGVWDLFQFWREGKFREAMELFDAFKTRDIQKIADELGDVAESFGVAGADLQLNELAKAIKAGEIAAIVSESCDVAKLVAEKFRKQPVITTMATPHIDTMTRAEALQWLADNRANIRRGGDAILVKKIFRNYPEVPAFLKGTMQVLPGIGHYSDLTTGESVAIDPDRLARIIEIMRWAVPVLTAVSAFVPYLIPVVIVFKFIIARYDANHPTASGADIGLELGDLV